MTKEDPRAAYIAIATKRFAAEGYHGTSLAAVAQAAGVSKQALLHFFGTKAQLYAEVLTALSERLCAGAEAAYEADAGAHLRAYFLDFRARALADPADIRLVVRALLESDPKARKWPLKAYIDVLVDLVRATEAGRGRAVPEVLAQLAHLIGMIQYAAISETAIAGMYGAAARGAQDHSERLFAEALEGTIGAEPENLARAGF